jgi:tRNA pseudouridine38-40 synthase
MSTFKLTLAYDGTDFVGWQRQASGISIQGLIEDALRDLDRHDVAVAGAGRTDAGVHALGQVASFTLSRSIEGGVLLRAVNARLPASVRVLAADEVPATFHARFGATRKVYRYRIWNRELMSPFERAYAWHVPEPLDTEAMQAAAALVEGRHDFAAFQASGSPTRSSERDVFSSVVLLDGHALPRRARESAADGAGAERDAAGPGTGFDSPSSAYGRGALVEYDVAGNGFLRHMVRNIVGSLVEIGRARRPVEWMTTILHGRDRKLSGPTAPPHGLVLVAVEYHGHSLAAER